MSEQRPVLRFIAPGVMSGGMCRNAVKKQVFPVHVFDMMPEALADQVASGDVGINLTLCGDVGCEKLVTVSNNTMRFKKCCGDCRGRSDRGPDAAVPARLRQAITPPHLAGPAWPRFA